jgi:hypothetical protein
MLYHCPQPTYCEVKQMKLTDNSSLDLSEETAEVEPKVDLFQEQIERRRPALKWQGFIATIQELIDLGRELIAQEGL